MQPSNQSSQQKKQQQIIRKQELFVHPLTILQKQQYKVHTKSNQIAIEPTPPAQPQNTPSYILSTQQFHPQTKTKKIVKPVSCSLPPSRQKNYRTSMCPQGIECRKRLVCHYAHNQYQLRRPYKNRKNVCIRYQKGLCSLGAACPDYHGNMDLKKNNYKYKFQKCTQWAQKGTCPKGKLCIYIHDEDQDENDSFDQQLQMQDYVSVWPQGNEVQKNENKISPKNDETNAQNSISNASNQIQAKNKQEHGQQQTKPQIRKALKIGDIFSQKKQVKKPIVIEVIEEKIQQNKENTQQSNNDQNFNIQFNF